MRPSYFMAMNVSLIAATAAVSTADGAKLRTVRSQSGVVVATKQVEVAVTKLGGRTVPVTFFRDSAQPVVHEFCRLGNCNASHQPRFDHPFMKSTLLALLVSASRS